MSNAEYRAKGGISSSDLKAMVKSMMHYKYYKEHPESKDSKALLIGRATHKWILEPYSFYDEFAIAPDCDKRTKEGKATWEKFVAESNGKDVISQADFDVIQEMREALYATPFAKKLLDGEHEKSFFWTDERTGIECKARPDTFSKIGNRYVCCDYKTTTDAETSAFMRQAIRLSYDLQSAHYCEGLKATYGHDFDFVFICQEKNPPFAVNILQADESFMASGAELRNLMLDQYKECLERNEFPSYMGFNDEAEIGMLSAPSWLRNSVDIESEEE